MTATTTPTIDPEFAALLVPLTEHENALLLDSLKREGCRDPLTVWAGHNVLLDGHARLRLCQEHGIPFAVREIKLADRDAAREWVWQNQAGRRNMRPSAAAYTRGVLYRSVEKRPGARTDLASGQDARKWASEDVARLFGLDESTIRRDARFARDLDLIAADMGEEFRLAVLTGKARLSRKDVQNLAGMSLSEKERYLQKLEQGEKPRRKKEAAAPVIEPAGPEARPAEQDDAGPISGDGSLPGGTRPAPTSPIAGASPLPDRDSHGPASCRADPTPGSAPVVALSVAEDDAGDYDHDRDALDRRDEDPAPDDEPDDEPVDEKQLEALTRLFHKAKHATRLAFLGQPLVRAALDRLHAMSA